jgi:hypothetical protein
MMETIKELCDICGVEITGWGRTHFEKNKVAHMENQHPTKEVVIVEDVVEEVVEDVVEDVVEKVVPVKKKVSKKGAKRK